MDAKAEQLYWLAKSDGNQQYIDDIIAGTKKARIVVQENAHIIAQRLESAYIELLESTSTAGQKSVSKTDSHSSELLGAEDKEISPDYASSSSQEKSVAVEKSTVCRFQEDEIEKKFSPHNELNFNKKKQQMNLMSIVMVIFVFLKKFFFYLNF